VKHISALVVKFLMTAFILEVALLLLSDLSFGQILFLSLIITIISYLIGDMVLLPATNNAVATIADMILNTIIVYLFNFILNINDITFIAALISGILLGVGEFYFHKIIDRSIDEDLFD
jgi:hypothetical protein